MISASTGSTRLRCERAERDEVAIATRYDALSSREKSRDLPFPLELREMSRDLLQVCDERLFRRGALVVRCAKHSARMHGDEAGRGQRSVDDATPLLGDERLRSEQRLRRNGAQCE